VNAARMGLLLMLLVLEGSARADVLPDPDSVDAHCSLAELCPDGAECPSGIRQDAGVVQACEDAQKAKGRAYRCHRGGNYLGTAVFCRADAHGSWSAPPAASSSGSATTPAATPSAAPTTPPRGGGGRCSFSAERGPTGIGAVAAGVLALLLVRRVRRPSSRGDDHFV
jgi:hypothetical protein